MRLFPAQSDGDAVRSGVCARCARRPFREEDFTVGLRRYRILLRRERQYVGAGAGGGLPFAGAGAGSTVCGDDPFCRNMKRRPESFNI